VNRFVLALAFVIFVPHAYADPDPATTDDDGSDDDDTSTADAPVVDAMDLDVDMAAFWQRVDALDASVAQLLGDTTEVVHDDESKDDQ
jgi:hypothetical protein